MIVNRIFFGFGLLVGFNKQIGLALDMCTLNILIRWNNLNKNFFTIKQNQQLQLYLAVDSRVTNPELDDTDIVLSKMCLAKQSMEKKLIVNQFQL